MSTNDDTDRHDSELKSYLEGDDISATYRQASGETPPPALDAFILKTAGAAVQSKAGTGRNSWRGAYQLAASFVVGVLVTSLYFDQPDDPVTAEDASTARRVSFGLQSDQPIPAAAERAVVQTTLQEQARTLSDLLPAVERQGLEPVTTIAERQDDLAVELASARAGGPGRQRPNAASTAAEALEEITVVTGSRIRAEASYRDSQETWLAEIQSMSEDMSALTAEQQVIAARLTEEKALFQQAFPEVNVGDLPGFEEGSDIPE